MHLPPAPICSLYLQRAGSLSVPLFSQILLVLFLVLVLVLVFTGTNQDAFLAPPPEVKVVGPTATPLRRSDRAEEEEGVIANEKPPPPVTGPG